MEGFRVLGGRRLLGSRSRGLGFEFEVSRFLGLGSGRKTRGARTAAAKRAGWVFYCGGSRSRSLGFGSRRISF